MNYNNIKKIKIKTVQIDNRELEKCKSGKEFKVKLIARARPIIIDPPRPMVADAMRAIADLAEIVQSGFKSINTRLDKVETTLAEHGEAIAGVKTELTNVIKLNNLKH
jgi:hypothetical protein